MLLPMQCFVVIAGCKTAMLLPMQCFVVIAGCKTAMLLCDVLPARLLNALFLPVLCDGR
jgi:hypothetical protein